MNVHLPHNATDAPHPLRLLPELQQAVNAEIAATRAKAAIFRVEVLSGKLLAESGGFHTYAFQLSTVLPVLDDTPGELHIGSQVYPCRINAVEGLQVAVALATAPAQVIERAMLIAQPWVALERLSEELERCAGKSANGADLSAALLAGESSEADQVAHHAVGQEAAPLTEGQQHALAVALQWTVSVIAGPVDSGKTFLLGRVAAAYLAAGRRVLLLASTNGALDDFLASLFDSSAAGAHADGDLLRCGRSANPALQNAHPQLLPERVESRLRAEVEHALVELDAELAAAVERNQALSVLQKAVVLAQRTLEERDSLREEVDALVAQQESRTPQATEHAGLQALKERWERVWQRARRLTGRSERSVRRRYRDDSERQRQEAYRLAQQLAEAQRRLAEKQAAVTSLESSLDGQLKDYGLTSDRVDAEYAQSRSRLGALQEKRGEIVRSLAGVTHLSRARARLVASTVAQALVGEAFDIGSFDVVLVDDAHRVPMPQLFWAAALASSRVIVTADTAALQPWHCAPQTVAGRWLGRSIADFLAGKGVRAAPWVASLSERHTIDPPIAEAVSRWFVPAGAVIRTRAPQEPLSLQEPRRKVTRPLPARGRPVPLGKALANGGPLVFVDTGAVKPWSEVIPREGRLSLGSALAAVGLAERLHAAEPTASIALITPYAAQARLLRQLARDREIAAIDIYAPPNLPSRPVDVVILDTVETPGGFAWSALDDSRPDSQAQALFSCVCALVKQRLLVVAHWKHVRDSFGARALLRRMLGEAVQEKSMVSAAELVQSVRAGTVPQLPATASRPRMTSDRQSQSASGWHLLLQDLQGAERSVTVWSPQLALETVERVLGWLPSALIERGAVRIITLPQGQRTAQNAPLAEAREICEQVGVVVEERSTLAANVVIVDDRTVWECTFPPLGAPGRGAGMRRIKGTQVANLLDSLLSIPQTGSGTPDESGFMPYIEAASLLARSARSPAGHLLQES